MIIRILVTCGLFLNKKTGPAMSGKRGSSFVEWPGESTPDRTSHRVIRNMDALEIPHEELIGSDSDNTTVSWNRRTVTDTKNRSKNQTGFQRDCPIRFRVELTGALGW